MIDNAPDPLHRIRHPEQLDCLLRWATIECGLGCVVNHRFAEYGYDDCNVVLRTNTGQYVVKIFSSARSPAMSTRYGRILESITAAGVPHPPLHRGRDGGLLLHHPASGNPFVVMDFVTGSTFLELGDCPNVDELGRLIEEVHRIHAINLVPGYVHDWWAIPHIAALADEVMPLLDTDEREYVDAAVQAMAGLDIDELPKALVHGDLTKANVMRTGGGDIAILDFAVANFYPRIHELAMIAVNLMHGDPMPLAARADLLVDLYDAGTPLVAAEHAAMPVYVFAAAAMELLGATREWTVKGNRSAETEYLLSLGRTALRAAAC